MPAVRQVADGIWSIVMPLSPGILSAYLVRGESLALVDTGYVYNVPELRAGLRELGVEFADLDLILMTHGHADHVGACAVIGGGTTARALVHRADLELLGGVEPQLVSPVDLIDTMRAIGRDDEVTARIGFLRRSVDAGVPGAEPLDDGQVIDLGGGRRLTVLHVPGHTPGSAVFFDEATGVAMTGDAVQAWGGRPGVLPLYADPPAYEASLRRIRGLDPAVLALAHPYRWSGGGSTPDVLRPGAAARRTLADSLEYLDAARAAVAEVLAGAPLADGAERRAAFAQRVIDRLSDRYWPGGPGWEAASAAALLAHAKEF